MPRVHVLAIDGLGHDLYRKYVEEVSPGAGGGTVTDSAILDLFGKPPAPPTIEEGGQVVTLRASGNGRGAWALAQFPSVTFCNWASVFSGLNPRESGMPGNQFLKRELGGLRS